jgi:uncharacterized cupin superfamily protein
MSPASPSQRPLLGPLSKTSDATAPGSTPSGSSTARAAIEVQPERSSFTGVWEATPGETRSIKGETFEFCHILTGVIEITPDGGEAVTYRAGDSFVMKPGFTGVWKTIETVRKIYVTVG